MYVHRKEQELMLTDYGQSLEDCIQLGLDLINKNFDKDLEIHGRKIQIVDREVKRRLGTADFGIYEQTRLLEQLHKSIGLRDSISKRQACKANS